VDHHGEPLIGRAGSLECDRRSVASRENEEFHMALRFDAIFLSFAFAFVGAVLIGLF